MDESVLRLLDALKWPLTLVVLVLILRRPLGELLSRTKQVKYKGKELHVEFERIEAEARQALPPSKTPEASKTVSIDLYELAETSPTAAVVEAWRSVEGAAKRLLASRGHNLDYDVPTVYRLIQDTLVQEGIVDARTGKIFGDLRQVRNKVTHAEDYRVSVEQARQFVELAIRLREHFEALTRAE